ncbi:VacJ family lipoprotein [Paraburkholderia sp. CNPSo 3281]|uniref:MlaA family lipoprotein n=1 Tax=Paraburkholderia sp. CNPSo 3281 TaxID=2940933 RepID=UPI0020B828D9|nr:VacJ family lipoprotein [Paraburkholderia sp. CNPSo 3281]MCP3715598.1 VacJ family lipoprotein [Paraburkholderia sp. CNPSo 3281]
MKKNQAALTMAAAGLALLVTSGCATGPDRKPGDPFEPANRAIFTFNDKLDTYIAQPVAKGYQKVTPQPLRQAITNFFSNIGDVDNFANNVLQLKITDAVEDLMRIAMNTTFGLGGLIDFATAAGLPKHHQDFGLTMGHYGMPAGPYLVLPLFGPSSVRDGIGMAVDVKFNVINYFEPAVRNPMYLAQFISARADLLGATDLLKQAALDPYSFVRDAYRQQRESLIRGSRGSNAPLPNYGEPGGDETPNENGAPNYEDPGESGGAGGAGGAAAPGASNNGLPNYEDPGEGSAAGAAGAAATTGAAAAGAGPGAAAAAGTAGVAAAAAASAPATASAPVAASGGTAVPAKPASAP